MEALNASPSHSEDETEEGGPVSEKDDEDLEEEEEMDATPMQVKDSGWEETAGKSASSTSFSLDEMMNIGTVDQQEQEAQMCLEDHNDSTVLEEEETQMEVDAHVKPNVDMKVDGEEKEEEVVEEVTVEEEEKEKEEVEDQKEKEEVEEVTVEEEEEKEVEEEEVDQKEEEKEKEVEEGKEKQAQEVKEKEAQEVKEKEAEEVKDREAEEVKEKEVEEKVEEVKEKEVKEEVEEEMEKEEEEHVPFYATRSKSRGAATTSSGSASASDMTNGTKVNKHSASSSSSSSPPPPIKVKDEPEDDLYEVPLASGTSAVKDEPIAAKEEEEDDDLIIDSVYTVNPDSITRRSRGRPSSSTLNMLCSLCRKRLIKGQTAYQRKGSPALFCSTACLTSSLTTAKSVKNCYHCHKRISRPQEIILAPDVDGVSRGFCSEPCLNAFNLNKSSDAKSLADSNVKLQSACSMCSKFAVSKHEVVLSGTVHKMCSDACFKLFRTANRLTMAGCANCNTICHFRPLLLKMDGSSKTLCNLDCLVKYKKKVKTSLPCTMCRSPRPLADMVHNKSATDDSVSLFCSSSCIMAFMVQSVSSSGTHLNCENCGKNALPAYHLAMSDTTIRNFCTLPCVMTYQEKFKQQQATIFPKLTVASGQEASVASPLLQGAPATLECAQCARQMTAKPDVIHIKDKVVFVCGWNCALEFKTSKNVSAKCEYCKMDKISREVKRINGKDCAFCSHGCKLLYEHDLDARWGKHCKSCSYCQCVSKKLEKALYGESSEEFCSEECRSNYTMLFCHVAKCASCGRKGKLKHSLFVLGEVRNFCDLPCLFHFCNIQVKTQGDVFSPASPVIANVVSLAEQETGAAPDKSTKQLGDHQINLRKRKEESTGPRTRGSMASCSLGQGKQPRKYTVRQVLEQLEADDSDFGAELDSDSDSDEWFQAHESEGGESSAQDSDSPDDSSSDEDLQFAETASPRLDPNCATKTYSWRKKVFESPDVRFQGQQVESYQDATTDTPLVYFRRFVSRDMLENIVQQTNRHSVQKHGKCVNTSVKEIEQVLGMYLRMGLVQMSGVRQYWESEVRYGPVADVMSHERFKRLLSVIHFVDNEMANGEVKTDRLWKLRPFLDSFRRQCLTIAPRQKQSIDEMTVPCEGPFGGMRRNSKGKPHGWGFKVWARCCVTGLLHDFDVCQGKGGGGGGEKEPKKSPLGVGGDVVVKLCRSLAENANFLIFAGNFFTSMPLIETLLAKGIYYTGTVRKTRMATCNLVPDQDLSEKGRGSYDYQLESDTNAVCLKWHDTKAVSLMSTYAGPEPLSKARRWDKSKKEYAYVDQPNIIKEFNASMGGVDVLDALLARCQFRIRTRRWYLPLFWHFTSVAVINAWLLYRRDCEAQGIAGSRVLKLRKFQGLVAQGLVEVGTARKRARPSSPSSASPSFPPPPRFVRVYQSAEVRLDQVGHWPVKEEHRRRCAVCKDLKTEMHCEKCAVPLCINKKRNCFKDYHNV
ncbi:uncharacterized protein LOC144036874 isoform X3 [Vanacampus margaritifer]